MVRARTAVLLLLLPLLLSLVPGGGHLGAQTRWQELPALPDPQGFAGAFVGVVGDTLLFAGGANFPEPVWDHQKQWTDRVFALERPDAAWREVGRLPGPRGYGAAVSLPDAKGLLCLGGDDAARPWSEVFVLGWDGSRLTREPLPDLPLPLAQTGAARIGSKVYVVAGQSGGSIHDATDRGFVLDLDDPARGWRELPPLPGGPRVFAFTVAQHDGRSPKLHVFGGRRHAAGGPFDLEFLADHWQFDPATERWRARAPSPVPLMAGAAAPVGQASIAVLSYADGSILRTIAETGAEERSFDHPGFPRPLFSYLSITDTWARRGEIPPQAANQVTTTAVLWQDRLVVPSGELRPRVRTPRVWAVDFEPQATGFAGIDWVVLVLYLLGIVGVGAWFARRNRDTNDFFRGGQHVPFWAAACSIYATMLSSLTYLGLPALVFATDWLLFLGMFMILAMAPVAIRIAMPFFRRIDATSAYEYFGLRFGRPVRWISSGLFTLFHVSRMGIVMALTALALSAVTGMDARLAVLVMGALCLVYCTMGGIEAVIWTDTVQTFVLLGGALLCVLWLVGSLDGGFGELWTTGHAAGKFRLVDLDFSFDSFTSLSIWVIVLGGLGQNFASYTADQAVVQRYVTTRDEATAARAIWMNGLMVVPGALLFFTLGTGLWAFYRSHPERLSPALQNDQVFAAFLGSELPVGLTGLLVAGVFAAAQSTVSTSMNSSATTLLTDFVRPLSRRSRDERAWLRLARWLTAGLGVLGTAVGIVFVSPEIRSLMETYFKVIGMFMGGLGGLFLLGVASRRAHGRGALVGLLASFATMLAVWQLTATNGYLYAAVGIGVCWLVGWLASWVLPAGGEGTADGLTL